MRVADCYDARRRDLSRDCPPSTSAVQKAMDMVKEDAQRAMDKAVIDLGHWSRKVMGRLQPAASQFGAGPSTPPLDKGENASSGSGGPASRLDLQSLNPSLYAVGLDVVESMMPRYLPKAGIACERMQHAELPVDVIRRVLQAIFVLPEGETEQPEAELRECFAMFDASGDGTLDEDEFLAVLPLLGEDVPEAVVPKLFAVIDADSGGTIDGSEFVRFMRLSNPTSEGAPDGWRAFLPESAAHFEEMVLLHIDSRRQARQGSRGGKAWEPVAHADLEQAQRQAEASWSKALLIPRADVANCEALIAGIRALGWKDDEVRTVARALFVTNTNEDYHKVFQIFDRDATGGIDPFEFRAIMALLGDHSTEGEARQLFLDADGDNDGVLDADEFVGLLERISPKASTEAGSLIHKDAMARERLQARIAASSMARVDPEQADAMMQVLVIGPSKSGKTFLLNQVLAEKLPKGFTVAVGVGALSIRIGAHDLAVQVLDTPGDARFAPLGQIFYPTVPYAIFLFDATSFDSFEAVGPLLDGFQKSNPHLDLPSHVCLVANSARLANKRAVSSGYVLEWCRQRGDIPFFEVDPEAPQGILEPLINLADEFLTANPIGAHSAGLSATLTNPGSMAPEEHAEEPRNAMPAALSRSKSGKSVGFA